MSISICECYEVYHSYAGTHVYILSFLLCISILYRLKLHVCITHLHAHSSSAREVESNLIVDILKPYLTRKHPEYSDRVVLMGDMNTLSPWDKQLHAEENIVSSFQRKDHSVFLRMKRKYLTEDGSKVNYTPMKTLLE